MDAREIASGLFAGDGGDDGGDGGEGGEDERAALMRAYARLGNRPRFAVQAPYNTAATRNFHVFRTTFAYEFDPDMPWLPDQIVDELRAQYDRLNAAGEFKTDNIMVSYTVQERTPGLAEFPHATATRAAARRAAEGRRTGLHRQSRNGVDWGGLLAHITREDHYDALDGAEAAAGNRLSRVVFEFTEYRIPYGRGAAQDLGLMPRALVELPGVGDGLCGQACLAYALAPPTIQKNMRNPARGDLLKAAKAMAAKIGVPASMNVTEFDSFTAAHPERAVVIMGGQTQVLYATKSAASVRLPVYLLLYLGHYYNINNMDTFVRPTPHAHLRWCDFCMEAVRSRVAHACRGACTSCRHVFRGDKDAHMVPTPDACGACNFAYVFAGCREFHRCARWKCAACKAVVPMKRRAGAAGGHVCGELYCGYCDVAVPPGTDSLPHRCFILKTAPPAPAENPPIYVYDIESVLDPDGANQVHRIAVIVAMKLNTRELHIFKGPAVETDFLRWIDGFAVLTTLVAHNGASYDSYMVLAATRRHKIDMPSALVVVGSKIPYMKYRHARFIDSMKHVAGSLEGVARTFGLEMAKSFFPYGFYSTATLQYVGDVPPARHFERQGPEFAAWHAAFAPGSYSIEDEVVKYCVQDCEILCRAMEKYRDAGVLANNIDPLDKVTVAGYAMATYRARHMPENTFPILTSAEYAFVRRGLFGGRTDVRQIMKAWTLDPAAPLKDQRHGLYVDVHSMYPSVQKYDLLPVGAPWWAGAAPAGAAACAAWLRALDAQGVCAMVECAVECPRDLYHPVLLERRGGRLVAALDIAGGVFTSCELLKALEAGYRVTAVAKALCSRTSAGAFASYVDKFGAMKELHGKAGPQPNPGLCALAKMMLNSLWGKFSQKDALVESRIFTDEAMWFRTVAAFNSGRYSELEVHEVTPSYVFASATAAAGENVHLRTTDVLLAAFVTARARLRLYAMMELVGERVIYHDTDSIVYEYVPGLPDVPLGDSFGEWGSELGAGHIMTEFVALGPKTYAYAAAAFPPSAVNSQGKVVVKSKGFTSGFSLDQYRSHAAAFLGGCCLPPLEQRPLHFARAPVKSSKAQTVTTVAGYKKKLSMSAGKMHVVSAERTLPFGHQDI